MYTNYVNNYNESIKAVTECKKKSQKFAEFLEVFFKLTLIIVDVY